MTATATKNINTTWYTKISNRKLPWSPIAGTEGQINPEHLGIIRRILSIRNLEADVAAWIREVPADQIPSEVLAILKDNISDESRHEKALDNLVTAQGIDFTQEELGEAEDIKLMWAGLSDSPIVLAGSMESGVFMPLLLMLRTWGTVSMGVTARDISGDEGSHTAIHRQLARDFGLEASAETRQAVIKTIKWLVGGLNVPGKRGNGRQWVQFALDLLDKGGCDELSDSETPVQLAPFECANNVIPSYS